MSVSLRPMSAEKMAGWIARGNREYTAERIQSGESPELAQQKADESDAQFFPDGRPLGTHRVSEVVVDGEVVGQVWIGPQREGIDQWWVWDVEIAEEHRRKGYARAALELAHEQARSLGATAIGLNVSGFNTGARDLYERLGYVVTAQQMRLEL